MGLFLAKRITRPVQRLAAGAREIGAGHLDHRIEPDTHDEFGALVEAFNTMAGELAGHWLDLQLGTNPIFVLIGFLAGAGLGAAADYRLITKFLDRLN